MSKPSCNQQKYAINCNFRQALSEHLITLNYAQNLSFLLKILIKNLIGKQPAWALAHGASKKAKLLAQGENLLVPDYQTGVISSRVEDLNAIEFFIKYVLKRGTVTVFAVRR